MLLAVPDSVDVPALIRSRLPELSPNDRRIAAWLLEHEAEAPFQTAESLARGAGVSKAAVVRFGSRLGFGGYAGLSDAMAGAITVPMAEKSCPSRCQISQINICGILNREFLERKYRKSAAASLLRVKDGKGKNYRFDQTAELACSGQ